MTTQTTDDLRFRAEMKLYSASNALTGIGKGFSDANFDRQLLSEANHFYQQAKDLFTEYFPEDQGFSQRLEFFDGRLKQASEKVKTRYPNAP